MFGSSNATGFSFGQPQQQQQQQQQPTFGFGAAQQQQPQPSGVGMFGSTTTSAFGSNTGFGQQQQQKPPTFGQPQASTGVGGFNVGATTNAFGGGGLMNTNQPTSASMNNGTGNPPWVVTIEREQAAISVLSNYQAISAMPAYKNWSIEELRAQDYVLNKKFSSGQQQQASTGAFGSSSTTTTSFGAPSTTSAFGQPATQTGGLFGSQPAQSTFGGGSFGAAPPSTSAGFGGAGGFGAKPFGATAPAPTAFGASTSTFGAPVTSTFGQPAPATSAFGQPAATSGFGQPAAATGAGMFGQQKPGGMFGSQPTATTQPSTGLFGQQQQQSQQSAGFGFGQQAVAAPATNAFSGFGQQANQPKPAVSSFGQPQAATGGLFGKPAPAPGVAPSLFGQNTQQPSAFGGATFGAQQQQQQPTGLFGQQQTQQPQPSGSLFGAPGINQPSTAAPAGSLFGGASAFKPAAPGGLFGGTGLGSTVLGGAAGTSTTSQPGFSFGAAPTGTAAAPQFGQTQQQPVGTTSLFQNSSMGGGTSLFGGLGGTAGTSSMGGGGSLFGGATFGAQTAQNQPQQQFQSQGPVLHASLNKNPYGINPLLQKSPNQQQTTGSGDKGPVNSTPVSTMGSKSEKKLPTLTPAFKVTPRSTSQIKLRGIAPATAGPTLAESYRNQIGVSSSASGANGAMGGKKSLHLLDGSPRDVVALGLDSRFTPRRSVKRLDIDDASIFLSAGGTPSKVSGASGIEAGSKVSFDRTLEDAAAALISSTAGESVGSTPAASSRNASPSPPRNVFRSVSPGSAVSNSATSYIMTPSIDQLLRLSDVELSSLSNFSICVPLYGSVSFLEPVDLLAASPTNTRAGVQDIPGNVVIITSQLVTVYPDDTVKHPRGQGLNVPAVITLASCFPKDRKTGDIIDNESDPRFDKHLKKLRQMPDTTFIGFEVISGSWKFRVEHFSKYGLLDSDESDEEGEVVGQIVPETPGIYKKNSKVQFQEDQDDETDLIDDTFIAQTQSGGKTWTSILKSQTISKTPLKSAFHQSPLSREIIEDSEQEQEEEDDESLMVESQEEETESEEMEESETESEASDELSDGVSGEESQDDNTDEPPKNTINAGMATVERMKLARNVQTMKATLFPSSPVISSPKIIVPNKPVTFSMKESPKRDAISDNDDATVPGISVVSRTEFASLPVISIGSPQKYARQDRLLISKVDLSRAVPYDQSITFGKHKSGALDAAFYMGRSFRSGFGPFGNFTCLKSTTHVSIKSINFFNESSKSNQSMLHNATLECILENTIIFTTILADDGTDEEIQVDPQADTGISLSEGCPKSSFSMNFNFSKLVQVSSSLGFSDAEIDTWKLCSALWDRLELDVNDLSGFNDEQLKAIENGLRKSKLSDWLYESCNSGVEQDLAKATNDIDRIFIMLSGNKLANAIKICLSSRNYHLATILSQLPTPLSITTSTWDLSPNGCPGRNGLSEEVQKDLIAQIGEWSKSTFKENPKKMAIWSLISGGAHLWDEDVLPTTFDWKRIFGLFFWFSKGGFLSIAEAVEQYTNNVDVVVKPSSQWSNDEFDLKYHLLQIFSFESWELEKALNPSTHCSSTLDYRISWLLGMLLTKVFSVSQFKDSQAFALENEGDPMQIDGESIVITSKSQDMQLLFFISQLEALQLWKWAVFAASFLSSHINRECTIRALLNRWYPEDDQSGSFLSSSTQKLSDSFVFLTEKLHVPSSWIFESKALKARYQNNLYLEIVCLLDVKKYQTAQDLLISLYAPPLIISGEFEPLSNLLSQFPATINQEIEWNRKGQILKTFVDCKLKYPDLSNTYSMLTGSERKILEEKVDSVLEDLSDSNLYLSWTLGAGTRKDQMVEENVYISVCTIVEYFLEISSLLRPSKIDIGRLCLVSINPDIRAQNVRKAAMQIL